MPPRGLFTTPVFAWGLAIWQSGGIDIAVASKGKDSASFSELY